MFLLYGSVPVPVLCDTNEESNNFADEEWVLVCARNNLCNLSVCLLASVCPVGASLS